MSVDHARRALLDYRPRTDEAPEARPASVALILHDGPAGLELLLIRRADRADDPWSGQVALPGGRRDPGDADLLATAIRETREETGIDLAAAEPLGVLDDLYPRTPLLPPIVVRPFVFAIGERPPLTLSQEVTAAFWVPLAELRAPATRREITLTIRDAERTFPGYVVGEYVIWGMTERIVTPFLDLLSG
ncbi:MAG: CoA pyrophosphatase [Gemmatimonadetes bacterium]|nr:CoA pyrophosphatase [Gemmatimonadota bacterium]